MNYVAYIKYKVKNVFVLMFVFKKVLNISNIFRTIESNFACWVYFV